MPHFGQFSVSGGFLPLFAFPFKRVGDTLFIVALEVRFIRETLFLATRTRGVFLVVILRHVVEEQIRECGAKILAKRAGEIAEEMLQFPVSLDLELAAVGFFVALRALEQLLAVDEGPRDGHSAPVHCRCTFHLGVQITRPTNDVDEIENLVSMIQWTPLNKPTLGQPILGLISGWAY